MRSATRVTARSEVANRRIPARAQRALRLIDEQPSLNAFVFVDRAPSGNGLVVAIKDNIDVRGMPTTAGGRHLPLTPRTQDAECVRRLRLEGCAILGKTGLYEYAMGGTAENPHFGDVLNPGDPRRDAGGSSSGSAAAVAAGICDAALGTDTLGSVRLPAAFCGVVVTSLAEGDRPSRPQLAKSPRSTPSASSHRPCRSRLGSRASPAARPLHPRE